MQISRTGITVLGGWVILHMSGMGSCSTVSVACKADAHRAGCKELTTWAQMSSYTRESHHACLHCNFGMQLPLLQVRLHIHLPCQLLSVVISAAVLPQALCKAGFPEHSSWKCATVGASTQVIIGFVLTTIAVALNERRLRRMYIRSAAAQRAAAMKAKMA